MEFYVSSELKSYSDLTFNQIWTLKKNSEHPDPIGMMHPYNSDHIKIIFDPN